jgi:hypothetical protein
MEINYVCSLGPLCHSSGILKQNKLKTCSYPFDWIFSNCDNIIHCINDDFKIFLNKSYYTNITNNKCGHSYYSKKMFWHHNPLKSKEDYYYYRRCANRFRQLLKYKEHKLFIMVFTNMDQIDEYFKDNIIDFNNNFSEHNYTLLVIYNIPNKQSNNHEFTYNDNIHFLELHTLSVSNSMQFNNEIDNDYLNNIINETYNFNINNQSPETL